MDDSNELKSSKVDEEKGGALFDIIRKFEIEDEAARSDQLKLAKKGEHYFRGYQALYWDAEIKDYRFVTESEDFNEDDLYYTKVINIYRAHGEAIIAAVTVDVPAISFIPDDAENSLDLQTAQNYTNASILIQRHNNAPLLFVKAMYTLWTQGFVAAYNYNHSSKDYGVVEEPKLGTEKIEYSKYECPNCGFELNENQLNGDVRPVIQYEDEVESMGGEPATRCPSCGEIVDPIESNETEEVPAITGITKHPKTRECIKIYGVTHVKVRPSATCQKDTPYLILESEEHVSQVRYKYGIDADPYGDGDNEEDRDAREVPGLDVSDAGNVTVKHVWFRPEAFFYNSIEEGKEFIKDYPDGAYGIFINGHCVKLIEESLDKHWTILEIPTSSHIHPDPMGKPLMDVQEIQNEIFNLAVETMEQGISQTFVNNEVLDLERFGKTQHRPGNIFPLKLQPGSTADSHFYSTRTATLSDQVSELYKQLGQDGQLVSGSFPSIYGGSISGGSKTFAEYAASRQQALQRLGTPYKAATIWWAQVLAKAVPEYVDSLRKDEHFAAKNQEVYLNKIIRADVEQGKIGSVEPDSSNSFPLSWTQKRDVMIELLTMNIPEINQAVLTPENATLLTSLIGITELKLPGQNARMKQYEEIQQMLTEGAQVEVGEFDEHEFEMPVLLDFIQGQMGRELKNSNPEAFQLMIDHLKMHRQALMPPPESQPQNPMAVATPNEVM